MAIIGPDDLPAILKVDSTEIKKYVLNQLGHPVTSVELTEDMMETALRTSGDFIAHYFPKEERLAFFHTTPLQGTYDLPEDAYWLREVSWDPATTRIGDIFGAESFLFCMGEDLKILNSDGELIEINQWDDSLAMTPFGNRKVRFDYHEENQDLLNIIYGDDNGGGELMCTPNHPVKIGGINDMIDGWVTAEELKVGDEVVGVNGNYVVGSIECAGGPTYSVYAVGAHCFYGCCDGHPILIH